MTDIKHTEDGDIDLSNHDLQYADSDAQHQKDILLAQKGHYKEHPETGVAIADYTNETDPEALLRTIKKEFAADGMKVARITITATGELETNATYEND